MMATRRRVVAVSTVLLLIFAVGVFFLVRLGMGAPLNGGVPPIVFSPDATPRTGDSSTTAADNTGTDGEPGGPGPRDDSSTTVTDNTRTTNPGTQPPRPAVPLSSIGGVGPRVLVPADGFLVQFHVDQAFSVQVRVVDVNLIQPGNELVIDGPAGEDVTKCHRGTIEPGETDSLCVVSVSESESAEPESESAEPGGHYKGKLELVVRAMCTSKTGRPCQNLPEYYTPSPDNPIDVTWNYYYEW